MAAGEDIWALLSTLLPAILVGSAMLAAPAAFLLLRLYRRALLRSMGTATSGASCTEPAAVASRAAVPPLRIRALDAAAEGPASPFYRDIRRSLQQQAAIYLAAGFAYVLVFASVWMSLIVSEGGFILSRLLILSVCYAWPIVPTLMIVYALGRTERAAIAGCYFALLALAIGYTAVRNPEMPLASFVIFWIYANALASLLFLAFLNARVRAVGPLVFVFMLACVTGALLLVSFVRASDAGMRLVAEAGLWLGFGMAQTAYAVLLAGFLAFTVVGWLLLKRVAERYRSRKTSDQALTLDAMWLLFAIAQSVMLRAEGWVALCTGTAAFVVYKLVARAGFAMVRPSGTEPGITLLLLRVFSLGRRSERLFDALSKAWLRIGGITMIAGPDLATSTVQPHEFLTFIGGGLVRRFVRDDRDLESRIEAMARGPDPDGRYRVSAFFCHTDTWQQTMRRLAQEADVVLMDLRSFAPGNQGCLYEIEQLLAGVDLRRVLLLVDATTDRAFLDSALRAAWGRVAGRAQAARSGPPEVRLLELDTPSARAVDTLLALLLAERGAAAPVHASVAVAT